MIAAVIYLLIFAALVRYNGLFGIFDDNKITRPFFIICLFLKALAVPAFYFVYSKLYGGLEQFDSGKFYHDVQVINAYAWQDPLHFLKIIFGLQEESVHSEEFRECLAKTLYWDNGLTKEFRLNDNRMLIRIHALLHFLPFSSWWLHALFSCICSFLGLTFIYRSLQHFFPGKEKVVFLILCFFPSLWFFTGGFIKEGLAALILGIGLREVKQLAENGWSLRTLALVVVALLSFVLKPYLLLWSLFCFFLLFLISYKERKRGNLIFALCCLMFFAMLQISLYLWKSKGILDITNRHQQVFMGVARGGIFLSKGDYYLQLPYDTLQIKKVRDSVYTIKKNVSYMYWDDANNNDTLYNRSNKDTLTQYDLVFMNPEAGSNLPVARYNEPVWKQILTALQNCLLRPFFGQPGGPFSMLASFENLLILISLVITVAGMILQRKPSLLPLCLICFALILCLLFGLTTPNTGAILRYRAPVMPFLLLAGLYYMPLRKRTKNNSV